MHETLRKTFKDVGKIILAPLPILCVYSTDTFFFVSVIYIDFSPLGK